MNNHDNSSINIEIFFEPEPVRRPPTPIPQPIQIIGLLPPTFPIPQEKNYICE